MSVLVVGSNGQLGRALQTVFPNGTFTDITELDITDLAAVDAYPIADVSAIINAAAFTNVDGCEDPENRELVEAVNVTAVAALATKADEADIPFVHISTDYVFDGTKKSPYTEEDIQNPVSFYGQSKYMSEIAAQNVPGHYILRTSWVIGDGPNFVRTMLSLGQKGINPTVVKDQFGRPTFTTTLAAAIKHLLESQSQFGIYNVSNNGKPVSWADFATEIYSAAKMETTVTPISTEEYFKDKPEAAKRPYNSVFDTSKIQATGFQPSNWQDELSVYIANELQNKGDA